MPSHDPDEAVKTYNPGQMPVLQGMSSLDMVKWAYAVTREWAYKAERKMRKKEDWEKKFADP